MQKFNEGDAEYSGKNLLSKTAVVLNIDVRNYGSIITAVIAIVSISYMLHVGQITVNSIVMGVMFISVIIALLNLAGYRRRIETIITISDLKLAKANQKLEEQALELKRANQDLEQFAYLISHDLKAPVRNLASFMKLLSSRYASALPADGREFVNMSLSGSEKLAKQIDDMLQYYRADRNLPPVTDIDLNDMIKTISMELGGKPIPGNGTILVENTLPVLKDVHPVMIYQMFQHLIANAVKFNANPEPEIKIFFKEDGDMVRFCFADNGIGIDNAQNSKLFKMFKRLHTHDKYEGTGIGLAICKKIINFYKGDIWFESELGKGTSFYFTLPKHLVGSVVTKQAEMLPVKNFVSEAA